MGARTPSGLRPTTVPYILVVGKAEAAEGWWERRTKAASTEKRPPLIVDAMIAEMRERVERKT